MMQEFIPDGTRVALQSMRGEFTGTVESHRISTLEEYNPPQEPNPDKPITEPNTLDLLAVDTKREVTVYNIRLDDPFSWPGIVTDVNLVSTYQPLRILNN